MPSRERRLRAAHASRLRMADARVALTACYLDLEARHGLTAAELAKVLIECADRVVQDAIKLEQMPYRKRAKGE